MSLFSYSPQTNGTIADVSNLNVPFAQVAAILNGGIDSTNVTPASLGPAVFSSAANPETRQRRNFVNYVVSGGTIPTSGTLSSTITAMVAYNNGKEQTPGAFPKTFTASKDTYVDEKDDGTYVFVEVANGALTGMTLTTNSDSSPSLRIAKVVTSGTAVTSVVQGQGADPIGNLLYPMGATSAKGLQNPSKFLVYRTGSLNSNGLIPFDTKLYDSGNEVDLITNLGRFTAKIAGFYHFDAAWKAITNSTNQVQAISLYKNGAVYVTGPSQVVPTNGSGVGPGMGTSIQLAAGDYVEIYSGPGSAVQLMSTGAWPAYCWFSGYLISAS